MVLDTKEFEKLPPAERLKKLKELEKEHKAEIEEAEGLMKRAQVELTREQSIPLMKVPELAPIDISKIFDSEEGLEGQLKNIPLNDSEDRVLYSSQVDYTSPDKPGYERDEHTVQYDTIIDEMMDVAASASVKALHLYRRGD